MNADLKIKIKKLKRVLKVFEKDMRKLGTFPPCFKWNIYERIDKIFEVKK